MTSALPLSNTRRLSSGAARCLSLYTDNVSDAGAQMLQNPVASVNKSYVYLCMHCLVRGHPVLYGQLLQSVFLWWELFLASTSSSYSNEPYHPDGDFELVNF